MENTFTGKKGLSFSQYRRTLKLETIKEVYIPIYRIKVQYNPDLFKHWKRVCGDSMTIRSTPYYDFLMTGKFDKYMELFRRYGRTDVWTTNNMAKFYRLVESIRGEGYKGELPVVLEKPIVKNKYNDSYEHYEGARRLSICLFEGIKTKVRLCRIL